MKLVENGVSGEWRIADKRKTIRSCKRNGWE